MRTCIISVRYPILKFDETLKNVIYIYVTIDGAIDKVLKFYFLLRTFVYNRYVKNHKTTFILKNIIAIKMI